MKCCVPRWKAFTLAGCPISFSVFYVALMTGLPALEVSVKLDGPNVLIEIGRLARQRMYEWEREWFAAKVVATPRKKAR